MIADQPVTAHQPVVSDRPVVADQAVSPDQPVTAHQSVVSDRPVVADQLVSPDQPVTADRPIVAYQPVSPDQLVSPDQPVVADRAVGVDEVPGWMRELAEAVVATPVPPRLRPPDGVGRRSAVLVLFGYGTEGPGGAEGRGRSPDPLMMAGAAGHGDPDLLLIQRRPGLRRHAGQPAFPGGAIEPGDESPVQAALREAAEEVGLDPTGVDVVAVAPELFIERSGFRVVPVLGWWRRPVAVHPADPYEVAAAERVGIRELADRANRLTIRHPSGFIGPAFRVRGMLVWGFTAGLVDMLLTLGGWETPWDRGRIEDLPPEATVPVGGA